MRFPTSPWPALACVLLVGLLSKAIYSQTAIRLNVVSSDCGIDFRHDDGSCGKYYIFEPMSAGLALFDYDSDGDIDIYFLNGMHFCEEDRRAKAAPRNALFRNEGNWQFTDVTAEARVGDTHHGLGVTVGDYDNDGDPDLYLNNFGPNVLYQNNGDGTFENVTDFGKVQNGQRVGAGASFLDADGDGDLDLYAANYIQFTFDQHVVKTREGHPISAGPRQYTPDSDTLFRNNGDGTFSDISEAAGLTPFQGPGMGIISADYDRDGDADVLVANDGSANFLFENDGHGRFEEVGLLSGFAYDGRGQPHGSMGVDCADYDNDGWLDFHVTSFQHELATLYRNTEDGFLADVTSISGAGTGTKGPVTWGNGFVDFDNDADRDIFIAAGHVWDTVHLFDDSMTYELFNIVLENQGKKGFQNVSDQCGDCLLPKLSSRGAAFDDLDGDGDVDVVLLNSRREPTLLRNDSAAENHWIRIALRGTFANRDGVGARIEVVCGAQTQVAEVHSGRGYQGHYGATVPFGLGTHTSIDRIRVHWPGGRVTELEEVAADQSILIQER